MSALVKPHATQKQRFNRPGGRPSAGRTGSGTLNMQSAVTGFRPSLNSQPIGPL